MHPVSYILYFNDKDRYQSFLSSISLGQELISNSTEADNTRGKYKKYSDQQRFQKGKYAVENGTAASVRKQGSNFPKINERIIREFKRKFEVQTETLIEQCWSRSSYRSDGRKRGIPLLLEKLDGMLQTYIRSVTNRGVVVTKSKAVATAKALMICYLDIVDKIDLGNSEW